VKPDPDYFITKLEGCAQCGGSGVRKHPAWERYWREYAERFPYAHGTLDTLDQIDFHDAFWRAEGYDDPRRIPDEEEPCPECEGTGIIRIEVRLEEALEALGLLKGEASHA